MYGPTVVTTTRAFATREAIDVGSAESTTIRPTWRAASGEKWARAFITCVYGWLTLHEIAASLQHSANGVRPGRPPTSGPRRPRLAGPPGGGAEARVSVNYFTEMCSGSEAGSHFRRIDSCITQLTAQGPSSRTCNESKEEAEGTSGAGPRRVALGR